MTTKETFIRMCHTIYDGIHGKEKINKIFAPISEEQLQIIMKIYNREFYKRIKMIDQFIESIPDIDNRVKINGGELNTSAFYINAMQHYTTGDY
tara:strand:- start:280 stop:561 length:282 start_codon:yes stop_codon:yes gene_type:complete